MREELAEIEAELAAPGRPAPETEPTRASFAEVGDLLFTVVNLARVVNVDPELALRATSKRFVATGRARRALAAEAGETWAELELDAQEAWYARAKSAARPRRLRPVDRRRGRPRASPVAGPDAG